MFISKSKKGGIKSPITIKIIIWFLLWHRNQDYIDHLDTSVYIPKHYYKQSNDPGMSIFLFAISKSKKGGIKSPITTKIYTPFLLCHRNQDYIAALDTFVYLLKHYYKQSNNVYSLTYVSVHLKKEQRRYQSTYHKQDYYLILALS